MLLKKGTYQVEGSLRIQASGIVLRGEGQTENDTVLIATGKSTRHLIVVDGSKNSKAPKKNEDEDNRIDAHIDLKAAGPHQAITDVRVPVGARSFNVRDGSGFKPGDTVYVSRMGNADWIRFIGMDRIKPIDEKRKLVQWTPFALQFDRVITAVDGNRITVDAPIACAIEQKWGGGEIWKWPDTRIEKVGVENLYASSTFDKSKMEKQGNTSYFSDEEHASRLVQFSNVKNAWARNLTAIYFAHGTVNFGGGAKWITAQDCSALDPVSIITGGRRYPFSMGGQLVLVQRCNARNARHAFVFGARICGPNAFVDCKSEKDHATSEPHHRWSVGGLYDNVQGAIQFADRGAMGSGHGWAGANYLAWNCSGSLACEAPPTAENYAIGFVGNKHAGPFKRADGYWESLGKHVEPRSLYLKQLEDRLTKAAVMNIAQ